MDGGVIVATVVVLTGERGVVRARAGGRARTKVRVRRVSFIVTVPRVVRLSEVMKNDEDNMRAGEEYEEVAWVLMIVSAVAEIRSQRERPTRGRVVIFSPCSS